MSEDLGISKNAISIARILDRMEDGDYILAISKEGNITKLGIALPQERIVYIKYIDFENKIVKEELIKELEN